VAPALPVEYPGRVSIPRRSESASLVSRSPERHAQSRVGDVLPGGYTLLAVVGVGGAAAVFEARDADGATVAVKLLHPHLRTNDALVRRFQREAALLSLVNHPGIVPILATGTDGDDLPFLVMPLLRGETLEELRLARGGTLPVPEAAGYALALLDVLAAVHAAGVVHRDVKPANVFRETGDRIRLLDFGLAGRLSGGDDDDSLDDDALSLAEDGELLGTLAFMAPEQAAGRRSDVGARSDLFAVGATLSKLVSGHDAHEGSTRHERLLKAATRPVPPLATRFVDASPELGAFVDRALSFHPPQRFADAASMRAALSPLGGPPAVDAATQVAPTAGPVRLRRRSVTMGLVALVTIGGSLAWATGATEPAHGNARDRAARDEPARAAPPVARTRREPSVDRGSGAASSLPSAPARSAASTAPASVVVATDRPDPMDIRR
jgi:serine/threonine protein kinase